MGFDPQKKYGKYKAPFDPEIKKAIYELISKDLLRFWNNNKLLRLKAGMSLNEQVTLLFERLTFSTTKRTIIKAESGESLTYNIVYLYFIAKFWNISFVEMYSVDLSERAEYQNLQPRKPGIPKGYKYKKAA